MHVLHDHAKPLPVTGFLQFQWRLGLFHKRELVEATVWHSLLAVRGLARGRSAAWETDPVQPADLDSVEAVIPFLAPTVARMVRFQLLTGCRPQDVIRLTVDAIDRTGSVWIYRPPHHKASWRGRTREVFVGPLAQTQLDPMPAKGPVFPCSEGEHWSKWGYANHVRKAVDRAVELSLRTMSEDGPNLPVVKPWTPNQLRHAAATIFRAKFGLEVTRVLLGHATTTTSEIYAEKPRSVAVEAIQQVG